MKTMAAAFVLAFFLLFIVTAQPFRYTVQHNSAAPDTITIRYLGTK